MKRVTKKNAWVVELYDDVAQESRKRITIPNEALKEAGWNPDNCFYIANYLDEYGMIELTQDGRRNDVGKSHVISKSKGHPLVQVNFNPFKKLRDADFYNVVFPGNCRQARSAVPGFYQIPVYGSLFCSCISSKQNSFLYLFRICRR